MNHSIKPAIAVLALLSVAVPLSTLRAQTTAAQQPEHVSKDVPSTKPTGAQTLATAPQYYQAGRFAQAEALCRQVLRVPTITVENGKQAAMEIDGVEYMVTPTILDGGFVELRTTLAKRNGVANLLGADTVAGADPKTLPDRIERAILLRTLERVVNEICQTELESSLHPASRDESPDQAQERIELVNAKLTSLQQYRMRLRAELREESGTSTARK